MAPIPGVIQVQGDITGNPHTSKGDRFAKAFCVKNDILFSSAFYVAKETVDRVLNLFEGTRV